MIWNGQEILSQYVAGDLEVAWPHSKDDGINYMEGKLEVISPWGHMTSTLPILCEIEGDLKVI